MSNDLLVKLRFIGKKDCVLYEFAFPRFAKSFDLVVCRSELNSHLEIWSNCKPIYRLRNWNNRLLGCSGLFYIDGLRQLPRLESIYVDETLQNIELLEKWPGMQEFVCRCSYISVPDNAAPSSLRCSANMNSRCVDCTSHEHGYDRCERGPRFVRMLRGYFESALFCRKLVLFTAVSLFFADLPVYVLLWLVDWLPGVARLVEWKKVAFIRKIHSACHRIQEKRFSSKYNLARDKKAQEF